MRLGRDTTPAPGAASPAQERGRCPRVLAGLPAELPPLRNAASAASSPREPARAGGSTVPAARCLAQQHPAPTPRRAPRCRARRCPLLTLSRLFSFLRCLTESCRASICWSRRGESFTCTGPEPPPAAWPAPTPAAGTKQRRQHPQCPGTGSRSGRQACRGGWAPGHGRSTG